MQPYIPAFTYISTPSPLKKKNSPFIYAMSLLVSWYQYGGQAAIPRYVRRYCSCLTSDCNTLKYSPATSIFCFFFRTEVAISLTSSTEVSILL